MLSNPPSNRVALIYFLYKKGILIQKIEGEIVSNAL